MKAFPPIQFHMTIKGSGELNYRFEKRKAFEIIGISTRNVNIYFCAFYIKRIATLSVAVVKRPGRILLVASCSPVSSVDMCSATVQCD